MSCRKPLCRHFAHIRWDLALSAALIIGFTAQFAEAAVQISTRPLTPQEVTDFGLTNTTQLANGTRTVGIGQPAYLEVSASKGTAVTSVEWFIDSVPSGSSVTALQDSPLALSIPMYDAGDRADLVVWSRKVLVPDVTSYTDGPQGNRVNHNYDIRALVHTASSVSTATISVVAGTYLGMEGAPLQVACVTCHEYVSEHRVTEFNLTDHSQAFKNQITGAGSDHFSANCISCHVLGYDKTPAADNNGWDDVAADTGWTFPAELSTNNWANMPAALRYKSNIQCESCHGPGYAHAVSLGDTAQIGISMSGGNCGQCHDKQTHHVKNAEWALSGHGSGNYAHNYVGRETCQNCHNGAGFVLAHDPDYSTDKVPVRVLRATGNEGISCAACHDPHGPGDGPHQVRAMAGATIGNGTVLTVGGDGILCMNCHQSRTDAKAYVEASEWGSRGFSGAHHGPQAEILSGMNAYEFGLDMPSTDAHLHAIKDSCVTCHMQAIEDTKDPAHAKVGGHTWRMKWDGDTPETEADDVHMVEACKQCHGEDIEGFNFGGEDWDRDGTVEGTQKEIEDLLEHLASVIPAGKPDASWSFSARGAYYNLHMVEEDGSHGVHNPQYVAALLQASIAAVTGGIDVDHDGLLDSWEMEEFGSLTTQTGDDDSDGDGLTNREEYSLGTDPEDDDSDNDGFKDGVEVAAGSNPMSADSVPDPATMTIIPAVEMGYLPAATGTVVQFQAIDTLKGGTWTNVGPVRTSDGNWEYHLDTLRDGDHRFYRATEGSDL